MYLHDNFIVLSHLGVDLRACTISQLSGALKTSIVL